MKKRQKIECLEHSINEVVKLTYDENVRIAKKAERLLKELIWLKYDIAVNSAE